ncbi:MAG: glutamine synthetase family protein [Patescibacteria group bacterium]
MTKEEIKSSIKENGVSSIWLCFTDILGHLKSVGIPPGQIDEAINEGLGFDGSSVEGFSRIWESDLIAKADPTTFRLLPWPINGQNCAIILCDILHPDGRPYEGDSRYILKKNLIELEKEGLKAYFGPELEYFYFQNNGEHKLMDQGGYFDLVADSQGKILRLKTVQALQKMGIEVEMEHHEVAPSQAEIDLKYKEALAMADIVMLYRFTVKEVARQEGYYATFMPKPVFGQNGSGMHCHQSLFKGEQNVFYEESDAMHLSKVGKGYLAGLLCHAKELTALICQWVNSYKRIVPGFEAPVYLAWGKRNRSALARIPWYKPGKEKATRIEFRAPDPACNPYLAFAAMIAAGREGIKKNYPLPAPREDEDIFHLPFDKQKEVDSLPGSLIEAINIFEKSELMKRTLGEHVFAKFIENKKIEWDKYRIQVTDFEMREYFQKL